MATCLLNPSIFAIMAKPLSHKSIFGTFDKLNDSVNGYRLIASPDTPEL
jgi:hypothetical protein